MNSREWHCELPHKSADVVLHELKISIPKYSIDDAVHLHPEEYNYPPIDERTQFCDVCIHITFEAALTFPALAHALRNPPAGCRIPDAYLERMEIPLSIGEFWMVEPIHNAEE